MSRQLRLPVEAINSYPKLVRPACVAYSQLPHLHTLFELFWVGVVDENEEMRCDMPGHMERKARRWCRISAPQSLPLNSPEVGWLSALLSLPPSLGSNFHLRLLVAQWYAKLKTATQGLLFFCMLCDISRLRPDGSKTSK